MVPQAQSNTSQTLPIRPKVKRAPPAQRNIKRTLPAQRNINRTPPAQRNTEKISQAQPKLEMVSQVQASLKPTAQVPPSPKSPVGGASVCGVPTPAVVSGSDRHSLGGTTGDCHKASPAAASRRMDHKVEPTVVKGLNKHALPDMDVGSDGPTGQKDPKLIKRGIRCDGYLNKIIPLLTSHWRFEGKNMLPTCYPVSFASNARVGRGGGRTSSACVRVILRCVPAIIVGVSVSFVLFLPHVPTG